ncbi:MAG TPA: VOC family protein [Candidatus Sulfotelmatobacter sp.]|nr:VOC family protein [Candidatus Sulfotelmatobacter sp.]
MPETTTRAATTAITWFEIPTADLDRAVRFYSTILETPMSVADFQGEPIAVFPYEQPGVGGCLVADAHPSPHGTLVFLNVDGRLDRTLELVEAAGGRIVAPKTSLGPIGYVAHIADSEGNRVGLHAVS